MNTKQEAISNYIKIRTDNGGFESKKQSSNFKHMLTVGDLRKSLEGVADNTPVLIEVFEDPYTSIEIPLFEATESIEYSSEGEATHFSLKGMDNKIYPQYKKAWAD